MTCGSCNPDPCKEAPEDRDAEIERLTRERNEARETNRRLNRHNQQLVREHARTIGQTLLEDGERIRQFWAETQRERNEARAELARATAEWDLRSAQLSMVCSEQGGNPGMDPENRDDPRWTWALHNAAQARAELTEVHRRAATATDVAQNLAAELELSRVCAREAFKQRNEARGESDRLEAELAALRNGIEWRCKDCGCAFPDHPRPEDQESDYCSSCYERKVLSAKLARQAPWYELLRESLSILQDPQFSSLPVVTLCNRIRAATED